MSRQSEKRAGEVAGILLDLGAVEVRTDPPFTWASGRFAPVYCDNRLILSSVECRKTITAFFEELVLECGWRPEVVAGTATAGIPHAAWLADRMGLPLVYVRGKAKDHGREKRVEGRLAEGQSVVVIEDLVSTGGSSVSAVTGVREEGGVVLGLLSIFAYGLKEAIDRFASEKIEWRSLSNFSTLIRVADERGLLRGSGADVLEQWIRDPAAWSKDHGGA